MPAEWVLVPDARMVTYDDRSLIIDTNSLRSTSLNATGRRTLGLLLTGSADTAAEALAAEYGVPVGRARADVAVFVRCLLTRRLIRPRTGGAKGAAPPAWLLWAGLTLAWVAVRTVGLARTVRLLRRWHPRPASPGTVGDRAAAHRLARRVEETAARSLLPAFDCKEKSVLVWHLLRCHGIPARLVLGWDPYPGHGHLYVLWEEVLTDRNVETGLYLTVAQFD